MKNILRIWFVATLVFSDLFCAYPISQGYKSSLWIKGTSKVNVKGIFTVPCILKKDATATFSGSTTSSKINFVEGSLDADETDNSSSFLFSTTPAFKLDGSKVHTAVENGTLLNVTVSGTGNKLYGAPLFSGEVTLASGSDIAFGIRSKMNVNVALGSGTMKLENDLLFTDSKQMTGTGTMNLQNYKLKFGAKPLTFSSAITWQNASDIDLGGFTTLSSTWTFSSDGVINGNGNVLDISSAGVLAIAAATTLRLTDLYLKGFGSTGNITFANATTSILRLSNVVIEMTGSRNITAGQVIIDGPVTIITKSNTLTFSSSGVLTINGQTLQYDRMGSFTGGVTPLVAGANLVLNNSGRVVEINQIDNNPGATISLAASTTLSYDLFLSDDRAIAVTQTATLTGNGHVINFADHANALITVSASQALTLSDVVLNGLQPQHISLGSGASFSFGASSSTRLHKNTTLSSTWSYSGDSILNGNGHVIDISSGGVLALSAGVTLRISDAYIKGLGSTGDITFGSAASTLRLSNVVIEMTGSKTISSGNVIIDGPVTIITKAETLTFDTSGVLTINGQTLIYDRLGNVSGGIVPTTAGANLVLNNSGRVMEGFTTVDLSPINSALATFDHGPNNLTFAGSSTLAYDYNLSEDHTLTATTTGTLNGNGHKIRFSDHAATQLTVNNSVTLTLSEVVLDDLQPSHISLGSGSDIIFGTNSCVRLAKNCTLNSTWKFAGNSMLDGRNKMLTLGSSGIIEAQAGANLTLKDLTIYDVNGTNVRCASNTATITFDNVKIINRNAWNFATGAFAVTNNLTLAGGGKFVYQSAYASTINDNSTLFLTDGMTFSYDPAKGSSQAVAGQQNLVFTNSSSKMICDGVTLKITNTGMRLTKGTIQFDRKCFVYSDANLTDTAHGLILGDGLYLNDPQIVLGPDSRLSLESGVLEYDLIEDGYLKYGDGIVLKHSNYGTYLSNSLTGAGGAYGNNGVGDSSVTDYSRFFIQPGDVSTRFGTGFIGTNVKSGDVVRFESFATPPGGSGSFLGIILDHPAVVSTPSPPYYTVLFYFAVQGFVYYAHRIYKKSGAIGDKIGLGDQVYIQTGLNGSFTAAYVGSSNLTYGIYKEVFYYKVADLTATPPPNFTTQFLWNIDTLIKQAYLLNPSNSAVSGGGSSSWAANPASTYQF